MRHMKQVISGLTYATKTAEEIAVNFSSYNSGDFRDWTEKLFKTKKGRFFVAGQGGPMSRWREAVGNGWTGGDGIIPLMNVEALEWCEVNEVAADVIAKHFEIEDA